MQDIPLAAVMRSPIVGMSDEEMAWMVAALRKTVKRTGQGCVRGLVHVDGG